MLRAVLPNPGARELWMLSGTGDESGFGAEERLPSIEEENGDSADDTSLNEVAM